MKPTYIRRERRLLDFGSQFRLAALLLDGAHVPHRDLRHRGLPTPTARLVDQAIRAALAERAPDVTGPLLPG